MINLIDKLIELIAPHYCSLCNMEAPDGPHLDCLLNFKAKEYSCYNCNKRLNTDKNAICVNCKKLVSIKLFRYFADYKDKEIKGVIEDFKFYDKFSFYKVIANVIFELIYKDKINNYRGSAIVCALPTSYKRARERGYDQAELIAKELAKLLGVRYREVFFRFKSKIKQKNLNRQGRALNAENIFMISPKFRLGGGVKTIILVDDIVTTGSTFNAAADLLASRLNNKISIIGLSFARTPSENEI